MNLVSIAQNAPGPLACARLRVAGAQVTKVEPPGGDPMLALSPSWHAEMHRDIPIEVLDLKADDGRERFLQLLANADVLMTSQRPAALARLGLDPERLFAHAPDLRLLRIVGSTAAPDVPGHDLTYQAATGLLGETMPRTLLADVLASERAYAGVLELLPRPAGSVLDVGLVESLDSALAPLRHGLTLPDGVLGGAAPRYRIYDTRAGRIAVGALEPHFARALWERLGAQRGEALDAHFLQRTAEEWEAWAISHDLPIVAVRERPGA
ncbi:MAG: CoA transferase [Cytophagaceae bacterium]|nr:CoA transferase [Gemmatimonadaceae bacterium]